MPRDALASFPGIYRRFEVKGEAAGRIVLDDYAHHPEEIRATLAAARAAFGKRIVAVFQPHRFTPAARFVRRFRRPRSTTRDLLYLLDVYAAGEEPIAGVSSRRLYEALRARGHLEVRYLGDESEPAARIAAGYRVPAT